MGERSHKRRQEDGWVRVLRTLRERKAGPSRFPCRRQQMANRSPLASSRRSIERLTPPSQICSEIPRPPTLSECSIAKTYNVRYLTARSVRGCDGDPKFLSHYALDSDAPRVLSCCVLGNSRSSLYPWV